MSHHAGALAYTPLHRIETRNALRNAAARGEITEEERRSAFHAIEDDLQDGFLLHTPFSWTDALRRADELSECHQEKEGQRTIDLLHVAVAIEIHSPIFLSFDKRQRRLARAAGLRVAP
jgi:predicted nucleic acid-binding protein